MLNLCTEAGYVSINKYTEQLCGDRVEIIDTIEGSTTLVLADGLGSGVKANILSTLTSTILSTMISAGIPIDDCVETVANTLPVCHLRQVAYSTFTIIKIIDNKYAELIQFDNPSVILLRDGKSFDYPITTRMIADKKILETKIDLQLDDVFIAMSDGTIYAGIGQTLNFGWQRHNIIDFAELVYDKKMSAKLISTIIVEECNKLYNSMPGDDTTVAAIKIRERLPVNLMIGPPSSPDLCDTYLNDFFSREGKRIVCGGTTSNIVSEYLKQDIRACLDYLDPKIPPMAYIKGVDLVTEGVITMSHVVNHARTITSNSDFDSKWNYQKDAASQITRMLFEYATDINFSVGKAINPAHQNPNLPINFGIKIRLIEELAEHLRTMGKRVTLTYY